LGLISPARVGAKNRLFSELDIARVKRIQRLTQELGVNLAGVEIILKLLDDLDDVRNEMERQMDDFRRDAEERIQQLLAGSNLPIRKDETLLPTPHLTWRRVEL
jgi:MerR family transcriptional regulator/heat shock protein HspR